MISIESGYHCSSQHSQGCSGLLEYEECDIYASSVYIQPDVARTWQTEGDCYQQTLNTAQIRQAVAWWRVWAPEVVSSGLIHALHFKFYLVRCVEVKRSSAYVLTPQAQKKYTTCIYIYIYRLGCIESNQQILPFQESPATFPRFGNIVCFPNWIPGSSSTGCWSWCTFTWS